MSLSDIVNVQISATSAGITRQGFGTALIAAYHSRWGASLDRVRSYTSIAAMAADGFESHDPAYKIASAHFSQSPRPKRVKIGLRALAPSQIVDLTPASPSTGKVYSINIDNLECSYTALVSDNLAAVCTALASEINTEAGQGDVDAIIVAGASSGSLQTITSFDGVIGGAAMTPARSLQLVLSSHADWDATTATITGTDENGDAISEAFAIPNSGNATVTGSKRFKTVTQVSIPAQSGAGGTFTLGIRARLSATGASGTKVVVTTTDAGQIIEFESRSSTLSLKDQTTDPGIATDLTAIKAADDDWYGLLLDSNSQAELVAAAGWTESDGTKLLIGQTADTACLSSGSTTDVMAALQTAEYARTHCEYHPDLGAQLLAAAHLGSRLPRDPGSYTWVFKQLRGVTSYELSDTEKSAVHTKNGGTFTVVGGVAITEGGKVAEGEWIDVVTFIDWLQARMRERVYALLLVNEKVPYTDTGIGMVAAEVLAQLNDGVGVGGLTADPAPVVTVPAVADIDDSVRATRVLPDVEFSATLAGAIHAVTITGSVGA